MICEELKSTSNNANVKTTADLTTQGQTHNSTNEKHTAEQQKAQAASVGHRLLITPRALFMSPS